MGMTARSQPSQGFFRVIHFRSGLLEFFFSFRHTLSFLDRVIVKSLYITITLSNFYFPEKLLVAIATTLKF